MNVRTALLCALVATLLTGCAVGQAEEGSASAPTSVSPPAAAPTGSASAGSASAGSASASASPTTSPTPSPTTAVRTVSVAYAGGQVTGTSGREEVPVGEQVVLRITSDVAEEVHVHGYDLEAAVPAGGSVDIPLTATIPGVFEVELHDSGKVLFQLRVA